MPVTLNLFQGLSTATLTTKTLKQVQGDGVLVQGDGVLVQGDGVLVRGDGVLVPRASVSA